MIKFKKIWPIALGFLTLLSFFLIFWYPLSVVISLPILWLISFLAIYSVLGKNLKTRSSRWFFWLNPFLYYLSSLAIVFLFDYAIWRYILAFLSAVLIFVFFQTIYIYIWEHEIYEKFSLENISNYLNIFSMFFLFASIFGYTTFLQIPFGLMFLVAVLLSFLSFWQSFWVSKIPFSLAKPFLFVFLVIISEALIVVYFLPLNYLLLGAFLALLWYTLLSLGRAYLLGFWSKKLVARYLVFSFILSIVIFISTNWL